MSYFGNNTNKIKFKRNVKYRVCTSKQIEITCPPLA